MRTCVLLFLAVVVYATAAPGSGASAEGPTPNSRPEVQVDRSCKPIAPIKVTLLQAGTQGSRIDLDVTIEPVIEMESLSWELELPADVVVTNGERAGTVAGTRGALASSRVQIDMPVDDSFRRIRVIAHGVFVGSDETGATFDEEVVVTAGLTWGESTVAAPTVLSPDAETGELVEMVVLPAAHRQGR